MYNENQTYREQYEQTKKKKGLKWLLFSVLLLAVGFAGYFGYQNPELFRAEVSEIIAPVSGSNNLFIPGYNSDAVDTGKIAIKLRDPSPLEQVHSMQFRLKYNPVNVLTFNNNSIVFDGQTLFQNADLLNVNTSVPGEVFVTFFSNSPVAFDGTGEPVVAYLNLDVNGAAGTTVNFTVEDVEVIHAPTPGNFEVSTNYTGIDTGPFNLTTQDNLRVLNAQAIDDTHVTVQFSDLLQTVGTAGNYAFSPILTVQNVESGIFHGYTQDVVVLTVLGQAAGQNYTLTVNGIQGNTQGNLDTNYNQAVFTGFGETGSALSDFNVVSATATDYRTIELRFSDDVAPASVNATGFTSDLGINIVDANVSGTLVTLTTSGNLLKRNTYTLTVSPTVKRESDNAEPGLNKIGVAGYKNGPRITSAQFNADTLTLNFDEPIAAAAANIGTMLPTGQTTGGTVIQANYTINGSQLVATNLNTSLETSYTFVANTSLNNPGTGLTLDANHNRIDFWGNGTINGINGVNAAQITRRNVVEIFPGNIDFNTLTTSDVQVFEYVDASTIALNTVSSISITAQSALKVVVATDFAPQKRYFITIGNPIAGVASASVSDDFQIISAQATAADKVLVTFSENLDQTSISAGQFALSPSINVDAATVQSGFQQVLLDLASDTNPGTVYTVTTATGTTGVRSFFDGKVLTPYVTAFAGYQTLSGQSDVRLTSIDVNSSTEVVLHFSGNLDANTVTPINIRIADAAGNPLTVTNTAMIDSSTVRVSTANQAPDTNYFVTFNGVNDESGMLLSNAATLNFFGYTAPTVQITGVSPANITNELEQTIVILGSNLDAVASARLGGNSVIISQQTAGAMNITVPLGFATGIYDLTLVTVDGGTVTQGSAVTVSLAEQPLRVVSEESRAIPNRVKPDGETPVTFWVMVEDPQDLANIDSVTIDLEQIGGNRAQQMTKDTGTQPQFRQFYTYTTTVDARIPTQDDPYQLAVEVRKGSEVARGTVDIVVTNDVFSSVAPSFDQVYVNPITVSPDGTTPVTISAKVSDPDGASTITSVIADLGSMGIGFKALTQLDVSGTANELVTGWFATEEFTVPSTVAESDYIVNVTATDDTGESSETQLTITVSSALNGPTVDANRSYVAPQRSIPRDGQTAFTIHAMVSDPDGVDTVDTVTAYMPTLGLTPVSLLLDPSASTAAKSGLYSSAAIVPPTTASFGVHEVEIVATDASGGTNSTVLQIDVADRSIVGDAPLIFSDKSYTTPSNAINDGQTAITLYTFVRDDDDDLDSVVVNLTGIGQVGPELAPDFGQVGGPSIPATVVGAGGCPTNSNTIVCMQPSFKEGADGQWFVLSGVTVSTATNAQSEPYEIQVIATDLSGKTTRGTIDVVVQDSQTFVDDRNPPRMTAAVPVSPGKIEVVFSEEIDINTLASNGGQFEITEASNVSNKLNVFGASVNATGTIVTLTTDSQKSGKSYVISGTNTVKDTSGIGLITGSKGRLFFDGYTDNTRAPVVNFIGATSTDTVEIEFQQPLRPSTVRIGEAGISSGGEFDIKITKADESADVLPIQSIRFVDNGKNLEVITAPHQSGERYRVSIENVASATGAQLERVITKFFKAINVQAVRSAAVSNQADLNGDGRVDFIDFTMFSAVYGKVFIENGSVPTAAPATGGGSALQPITPTPDATVPVTSPVIPSQ